MGTIRSIWSFLEIRPSPSCQGAKLVFAILSMKTTSKRAENFEKRELLIPFNSPINLLKLLRILGKHMNKPSAQWVRNPCARHRAKKYAFRRAMKHRSYGQSDAQIVLNGPELPKNHGSPMFSEILSNYNYGSPINFLNERLI